MKTVKISKRFMNKGRLNTIYERYQSSLGVHAKGSRFVPGRGNTNPKVVFIGEAPGEREDAVGEPFVGPSGELLTKMLSKSGNDLGAIYLTNVVKYRPPHNNFSILDHDYVLASRAFARMEINVLDPDVVVPLGRHAAAMFFVDFSITQIEGRVYVKDGRLTLPMFHPSYVLRQGKAAEKPYLAGFETLRETLESSK